MIFQDRLEAGQKLSQALEKYKNDKNAIILALPRGGVVTAYEVAKALRLPLDLVVPRKIGAPGNPEFAIGAITADSEGIFNEKVIASYGISQSYIAQEVAKEKIEAQRRLKTYQGKRPPLDLKDKTVILIDDGIATGLTMKAAIASIKNKKPAKIVVAIPVGPPDSVAELKRLADEVISLHTPLFFGAVGAFYEDFSQTTDEEVIEIMKKFQPNKNVQQMGSGLDI